MSSFKFFCSRYFSFSTFYISCFISLTGTRGSSISFKVSALLPGLLFVLLLDIRLTAPVLPMVLTPLCAAPCPCESLPLLLKQTACFGFWMGWCPCRASRHELSCMMSNRSMCLDYSSRRRMFSKPSRLATPSVSLGGSVSSF